MSEAEDCKNHSDTEQDAATEQISVQDRAKEYGGPKGKEPTRYGDWEKNGRCIDF